VPPLMEIAGEVKKRGGGDAGHRRRRATPRSPAISISPSGCARDGLARFVAPPQRCPASPRRRFARSSPSRAQRRYRILDCRSL